MRIRPLEEADEEEFIQLARESVEFLHPWVRVPTTAEAFKRNLVRLSESGREGFVLVHGERIVGFVNLNEVVREPYDRGQVGYGLFAGNEGNGYMTEGLRQVMDHAFQELGLHRLEADIQPGNLRSRRLVARLGFRREGLSPGFICIDDVWVDHERWAVTVDMYHNLLSRWASCGKDKDATTTPFVSWQLCTPPCGVTSSDVRAVGQGPADAASEGVLRS